MSRFRVISIAAVVLALAMASCGSSTSSTSSGSSASGSGSTTVANAAKLRFELTEWKVTPRNGTYRAGRQVLTAVNTGQQVHSLLILRGTDMSGLPARSDGGIDTTALGQMLLGELPDVQPGTTAKTTINLPAGTYTVMCNMAGMATQAVQANDMHTTITVTAA